MKNTPNMKSSTPFTRMTTEGANHNRYPAGTAPTILRPKVGSQLNDLIAAGACADLNSYSEQYGWKDMSYEDIYDACSKDGVLYAIPRSTGGYWQTLYYNADMAKELGLDLKQDMTSVSSSL